MMNGEYKEWIPYGHENCQIKDISKYQRQKIDACNIPLTVRIGSESASGIVYKISILDRNFALKVMPIYSDDYIKNNNKEIEYAKIASRLVETNDCIYFPYFIKSGFCDDFTYPESMENRRKMANEYAIIEYLKESFFPVTYSNYKDIIEDHNIDINKLSLKMPIQYMISELGKSDLLFWILTQYDDKKMNEFMREILIAISALQDEFIVHGDLHLGNILILDRTCGDIAAIHDFGSSRDLNIDHDHDYLIDYSLLVHSLEHSLPKESNFYAKIERMISHMNIDFKMCTDKSKFIKSILNVYF